MFSLASFALTVSAASSVYAAVVPRATPPAGWATAYLEPYDTYHTRYLAIGCSSKHNTAFFDQCCHPLLATQKAATALATKCLPLASSSASAAIPAPTTSDDDDYCDEDDADCEYCDDDEEEEDTKTPANTSTAAPTATKTTTSTTTPARTATKTSTTSVKTSTTRAQSTAAADTYTGGFATYYYQNGVAGACGTVHKDTDFIAAMDKDRYGNLNVKSSLCGKKVKITNPANKKSVTVTIADACPTCKNSNSIDLSEGAFKQIATLEQGMVGITWSFV